MDKEKEERIDRFGEEIIDGLEKIKITKEKDYSILGLKFNPFPPAGIPRHPSLPPLDESVRDKIREFIISTYQHYEEEEIGEYAGLTIVGDFGNGKTHLMQHLKFLIEQLNKSKKINFSAIACFIDRPEDAPQRVIHKLIEQIGLDVLRKFVWQIILEELEKKGIDEFKKGYELPQLSILPQNWKKLFEEPIKSNPIQFINEFKKYGGDIKNLQGKAKEILKKKVISDESLIDRYLNLLFVEKRTDISWDTLAGYVSSRDLRRKEVHFLNSIVKILRKNGYKMLYVFIDEFEDLSKLRSAKFSDYVLVLNTLINNERHWAVVVSLTEDALNRIQEESPPLYDRLTTWKITLKPLDNNRAKRLIVNYLNLAKENEKDILNPLSESLLKEMYNKSGGNYRSFIRLAHRIIEYSRANNIAPPLNSCIIEKVEGE